MGSASLFIRPEIECSPKTRRKRDAAGGDPVHAGRLCVFHLPRHQRKYLVLSGISAPFVSWTRFAVHVLLVCILLRGWSNPSRFRANNLPVQVLRGLFLFGSTIFNFLALNTLQLAETTSIFFFAPMVITALAGPLLGEWAGWRRWLAILAGFAGVLVITRPGVGVFGVGHVFALCSMLVELFLRHHDTPDVGDGNVREPHFLFGAGAGRADAAVAAVHGFACRRTAGTGSSC